MAPVLTLLSCVTLLIWWRQLLERSLRQTPKTGGQTHGCQSVLDKTGKARFISWRVRGRVSFDLDLSESALQGVSLIGLDLRMAALWQVDLRSSDLRKTDLRGSDLRGSNLQKANLQNANLEGADLRRANLQGADLRGANLTGANIRGADLEYAKLSFHQLTSAIGNSLTKLPDQCCPPNQWEGSMDCSEGFGNWESLYLALSEEAGRVRRLHWRRHWQNSTFKREMDTSAALAHK